MKEKNILKPDPVLKDYWSNNSRFADLFNQVFFHGETIIKPEKLFDKDTEESSILLEKERITSVSKARDVIKLYAEDAEFVLIGLENQMNIHYAMPVRSMLYDALRYTKQCKILEQRHHINKDLKDSDEFLSGITKNDRLKPVITLVVYYGEKQWDGSKKLSDMLNILPLFQRFMNEQSIHLLQVRDTGHLEFENPDNKDFFKLIELFYHNGKIDLDTFKEKYPDMEIYWETLAAIGVATGSMELVEYAQEHEGGRLNMCTALENLKQNGIQEGMAKGMITAYREVNLPEEDIIQKLQEKLQLSYEEAQDYLNQN